MSRTLAVCLILGDMATAIATILNSPGVVAGVVFAVLTSIAMAIMSSSIRSILWPTYFWDQPEPVRVAVPKDKFE